MSDELSTCCSAPLLLIVAARLAWGLRHNPAGHTRVTAPEYLVALAAVIVGAVAQGSVGFGFGMLAAPVLALVDEELVPGAVLLLGLTVAVAIAWSERGALDWLGIRWALATSRPRDARRRLRRHPPRPRRHGDRPRRPSLGRRHRQPTGWHVRPTTSTLVGAGVVSGVMGTLTCWRGRRWRSSTSANRRPSCDRRWPASSSSGASLALVTLTVSGEIGQRQVVDGLTALPASSSVCCSAAWLAPTSIKLDAVRSSACRR